MNETQHVTKNDLPQATRTNIVELLNQQLVDILDLGLQAKYAHWNVKGINFIALHELFDDVAEELEEYTDEIAERAVELGGVATGLLSNIEANTRLPKYPLNIADGVEHIDALSNALAAFGKNVRNAIDRAAEFQDADTTDLFTEVSRGVDKLLWKLEAHLYPRKT